MLEKKKKMEKNELLTLLTWLKGEKDLTYKPFKFDSLLSECSKNIDYIDVENFIDQLMIDLFEIYDKLKNISKEELKEKIKQTGVFNILSKELVSESMRSLENFIKLYEKILIETKFDYPEIKTIQKKVFNSLISNYIISEDYEKCIELKNNLKEV